MTTPIFNDAVQITAADFTPGDGFLEQWDGLPFSESPTWLIECVNRGEIRVNHARSREYDYAVWDVRVLDGSTTLGYPGDLIAQSSDGALWLIKELIRHEERPKTHGMTA